MADMFGGGEGVMASLDAQQKMGQIAMQKPELQQQQVKAQQMMMDLAAKKKMIEMVHGDETLKQGQLTPVERVERMAQIAAEADNVDEATKLTNMAYLMRSRAAQAGVAFERLNKLQLDGLHKTADIALPLIESAHDTPSLQAAVRTFERMHPGVKTGLENAEYTPELVEQVRGMILTGKQKADLDFKNRDLESKDRNRQSQEDYRDHKKIIDDRKADLADKHETRLEKNGGKPVTSPTKDEINAALSLARKDYPDAPDDQLMAGARSVASQARSMRRENPGLDSDAALRRAFEKSKQDGDWQTAHMGGYKIPFTNKEVGGSDKTKFTRTDTVPPQVTYTSADDVKTAFKAGKINKDTALKILREKFGMN